MDPMIESLASIRHHSGCIVPPSSILGFVDPWLAFSHHSGCDSEQHFLRKIQAF